MEVKIVLGHTFGDEGKGVTVQWLCKKALEEGKRPLVMRFSGGPQAAHTIFNGRTEHICSSFGSGVLLGVPTLLERNVFVDPICLKKEYDVLIQKGVKPRLYFEDNRIITPYDVLYGQRDTKVLNDGTCGKGIYPTFKRYEKRSHQEYFINPEQYIKEVRDYYKVEKDEEYEQMFIDSYNWMKNTYLFQESNEGDIDVLIIEGSQGLLLDMDNGFYPHVTPSKVGLNGLSEYGIYFFDNIEVYLVTRTYTTRHGNGYIPKQPLNIDLSDKYESNIDNEFQGSFKTGVLEIDLLNQAYQRHCIDNYVNKYDIKLNLVVTHIDVPIENNKFEVLHKDEIDSVIGKIEESKVIEMIKKHLCYTPNQVYYNDSVESDLKLI